MNVSDPGDWAVILGLVTGLLAGLLYLIRSEVNRSFTRLADTVRDHTKEIQPDANGGKSLADLHKKVDGISTDVQLLKSAVCQIEDEIEELR